MYQIRLKQKEERRLLRGHLWVFRNEIANAPEMPDGALCDVFSSQNRFIARGFYQAEGGIAVRILSMHQDEVDAAFLRGKLDRAAGYRHALFPGGATWRWVHGESDGLPGLMADRYGAVVSAQSSCAFYAGRREELAKAFLGAEGVEGVRLELPGEASYHGDVPRGAVPFELEGLRFTADVTHGQKTGFYLDQRENALAARRFFEGARVFDGHCYAGLWSCVAARAGARGVLGVDSSEPAIQQAREHAALNGLTEVCRFECGDVEEALTSSETPYEVVLLDPPPLAQSRRQRDKALGVYQALNRAALKRLVPGGYLITSSCSHVIGEEELLEAVKRAARSEQRDLWLVESRGQSADHPVLVTLPETRYLTCLILRAL